MARGGISRLKRTNKGEYTFTNCETYLKEIDAKSNVIFIFMYNYSRELSNMLLFIKYN